MSASRWLDRYVGNPLDHRSLSETRQSYSVPPASEYFGGNTFTAMCEKVFGTGPDLLGGSAGAKTHELSDTPIDSGRIEDDYDDFDEVSVEDLAADNRSETALALSDDDEGADVTSQIAILRLQIEDLEHSLAHDQLGEDSRLAIRQQIEELEEKIGDGGDIDYTIEDHGQPDLGPAAAEHHVHGNHNIPMGQPAVECLICVESFSEGQAVKLSCGHDFCKGWLKARIECAVKNEDMYPPKMLHKCARSNHQE